MSGIFVAARSAVHIVRSNTMLLTNSGALATGAACTAVIGFFFWWVAARHFSRESVGLASATISMMNFLGLLGEFGLGTLLIGESLRTRGHPAGLISAAAVAGAVSSTVLCLGYLAVCQVWPSALGGFLGSTESRLIFLGGCAITGLTMVLDNAFVGLLRSSLHMWRSFAASVLKLGFLYAWAVAAGPVAGETSIVVCLLAGQLLSLVLIAGFLAWRGLPIWHAPNFARLRPHAFDALGHHLLNLAAQSPGLVMPFLVTATLSAELNAAFFPAWMVFNVLLLGPASLTTLLFTIGSVDPARVDERLRLSLFLCVLLSAGAWLGVFITANAVLGLLGPAYGTEGGAVLETLGVAVFPVSIKYHYIAIHRLNNSMASASLVVGAGAVLELAAAALGARMDGLLGFTHGWILAVCVEALIMAPALARVVPAVRHLAQ